MNHLLTNRIKRLFVKYDTVLGLFLLNNKEQQLFLRIYYPVGVEDKSSKLEIVSLERRLREGKLLFPIALSRRLNKGEASRVNTDNGDKIDSPTLYPLSYCQLLR